MTHVCELGTEGGFEIDGDGRVIENGDAAPLRLNLFDLAAERIGILAKTRAGKTYAARVLCEEFLEAGIQCVVLDPQGVWFGLRNKGDGADARSYDVVVIGGPFGDVPIRADKGGDVAKMLAETRVNAVIDTSGLSKVDQRRFATDFCRSLFMAKTPPERRTLLHLFIDEAQVFAPQSGGNDEALIDALSDIASRGGVKGLGSTLITQRAATVHKNVLSQCGVILALRTMASLDKAAIATWFEAALDDRKTEKEILKNLPRLPIGAGYLLIPDSSPPVRMIRVRKLRSMNTSASPGREVQPVQIAALDVSAIREWLGDDGDDTESGEADGGAPVSRGGGESVPRSAHDSRVDGLLESVGNLLARIEKVERKATVVDKLRKWASSFELDGDADASVALGEPIEVGDAPEVAVASAVGGADATARKGGGVARMIHALVTWGKLTRVDLAVVAGLAPDGGTFAKYLSEIRGMSGVTVSGDMVALTGGVYHELFDKRQYYGDGLRSRILSELGDGGRRRMMETVIAQRSTTRSELSRLSKIDQNGGTFAKYLSDLRVSGLIIVEREKVTCNPILHMEPK